MKSPHPFRETTGSGKSARLAKQLASLSAEARAMLAAGALLGEFDRDLLAALTGLDDAASAAAIAQLIDNGHFNAQACALAEAAQRDALLELLSDEARVRLYAAAADALSTRREATPYQAIAAIATHALAMEDVPRAVRFALEAGMRGAERFENEAAERYLSAGLALLERERLEESRLDYLCALADVRRVSGDTEGALPLYEAAVSEAEARGETQRVGRLLTSLAKVHQGLDHLAEALQCCERSLDASLRAGDRGNAGRCLMTAARIHIYLGDKERAHADLDHALRLAREADDRSRLAEALALKGFLLVLVPDRQQEGLDDLHASIDLLVAQGDRAGLNMSYMLLGDAQSQLGDYGGAWKSFAQARLICQQIGNRTEEGIALINLATAALEVGNFGEAAALAEEAGRNAEVIENHFQQVLAAALAASARAFQGRLSGAAATLEGALERARASGNKYLEALVLPHLMAVRLLGGYPREAIAAGTELAALNHAESESRMHAWLAEANGRLGEKAAAERHAEKAWERASDGCSQGNMAWALRAKALVAFWKGDWDAARKCAQASQAIAGRLELRYLGALLEGLLGEIALADRQEDPAARFRAMGDRARALKLPMLEVASQAGLAVVEPEQAAAASASLKRLLKPLPREDRTHFLVNGPWATLWSGLEGVNS